MKQSKSFLVPIVPLLCLLLFVGNSFAAPQPDSTKVTIREFYSDAKKVLSELGQALKVGSEHVYEVLVKQQVVNSVTNIFTYLFLSGVCLVLIKYGNKFISEINTEGFGVCMLVVGVVLSLVGGIFLVISIQDTVTGFINPEYGAMQQIINLIKH